MLNGIFEKVLVIAPHCDDDVLGCGGLMSRVKKSGGEVHVLIAAAGDVHFRHSDTVIHADTREEEFRKGLEVLGVDSGEILFYEYEQKLDTLPIVEIVTVLDKKIAELQPTAVLIPYPSFHQDHKVLFQAAFAALRPTIDTSYIKFVGMYEYPFVVWDTNDVDGSLMHIDITNEIDDKVKAMSMHTSQIRPDDHLISLKTIRTWAERRGLEVGLPYAEAYKILKLKI